MGLFSYVIHGVTNLHPLCAMPNSVRSIQFYSPVDFKTLPVDCQNFVGPTALRVVWFNVGANLSVFVVSNCSMDALEDEMEKVHGVD